MAAISVDGFEWSMLMEYDASGRLTYTGFCQPGLSAGTAQPVWKICLQEYDGAGFSPISIKWADGSKEAIKQWSARASYTYS